MITIIIGALIVAALLFLGLRGQSPAMIREFRTRLKGYSDLLVYAAMVEDGIILNKDGSLLCAWSYRGDDLDSASAHELDALSERVNSALKRRGGGWMTHVDAIRNSPIARRRSSTMNVANSTKPRRPIMSRPSC